MHGERVGTACMHQVNSMQTRSPDNPLTASIVLGHGRNDMACGTSTVLVVSHEVTACRHVPGM